VKNPFTLLPVILCLAVAADLPFRQAGFLAVHAQLQHFSGFFQINLFICIENTI